MIIFGIDPVDFIMCLVILALFVINIVILALFVIVLKMMTGL